MDLSLIFTIPGKAGLFKLVSQGKSSAIMESLADGKRMPAFNTDHISSLAEIAIYTENEEVSLANVFRSIHKEENGGACPNHNESAKNIREYFAKILPDYDRERVYDSNIRKVLQWYNILQGKGLVDQELSEREKAIENEKEQREKADE